MTHRLSDIVTLRPIQLKPALAFAGTASSSVVGSRNVFHGLGARGTANKRNTYGAHYLCDTTLGVRVEDALDADGAAEDWGGVGGVEEGGAEVANGCSAEHAGGELLRWSQSAPVVAREVAGSEDGLSTGEKQGDCCPWLPAHQRHLRHMPRRERS